MIYGLYQSAAGMMVNEYRQGVIANNLANADTVGFKRDIASFAERDPARLAGVRHGPGSELLNSLTGGIWLGETHTDFSDGALQPTGNPLDVALEGPGFLMVQGDGQPLYTRDGRMITDPQGRLLAVTDGAAILGPGGQPIRLNPFGAKPSFDEQGRISQDGAIVGRLGIVDFENYDDLEKVGEGRFAADPQRATRVERRVFSGFVESSGVEPIKELVGMIKAARAYQLNAQMITLQDQTMGRMLNLVASG